MRSHHPPRESEILKTRVGPFPMLDEQPPKRARKSCTKWDPTIDGETVTSIRCGGVFHDTDLRRNARRGGEEATAVCNQQR